MDDDAAMAARVGAFYERHPYPPAVDDLADYRRKWDDHRRRAEACLLWPGAPERENRRILVAGCGTTQAARHALRWPNAQVTGIDLSGEGIGFHERMKAKYGLANLEVRQLPLERAGELGETFDEIVCTGVLHHLADPDAGLRALRAALAPGGALQLMVYAPYGRAGVYMIQDYCRRLGVEPTAVEVRDLITSLRALPPDHSLVPLLRKAPDLLTREGLADTLLNPLDRAYSVPQLLELLEVCGLRFGRWQRQAPYLARCGGPAATPHGPRLARLALADQYAALELFRGVMVRHTAVAYRDDAPASLDAVDFAGDVWPAYTPVRLPDTIAVRENLPPGASAVLINRTHTFTDLYLPISAKQEQLFAAIDGRRSIADIAKSASLAAARDLFQQLWRYDQIVFDTSATADLRPGG